MDQNLIKQAQKGDNQALEMLIQANLDRIYRICFLYLKNEADAEDATQETFVKIWKHLVRFDLAKNFETWSHQIAKYTCFDLLKKRKTIPLDTVVQLADPADSSEVLLDSSFDKSWLERGLSRLSPKYAKILSLYYSDELNFREISEQLNEPIDTIKSRHRRAIILLKKLLSE